MSVVQTDMVPAAMEGGAVRETAGAGSRDCFETNGHGRTVGGDLN